MPASEETMGNRSYVIAEKSGEATILLEANNLLPLLWVAALPPLAVGSPVPLPTASPRVAWCESARAVASPRSKLPHSLMKFWSCRHATAIVNRRQTLGRAGCGAVGTVRQ